MNPVVQGFGTAGVQITGLAKFKTAIDKAIMRHKDKGRVLKLIGSRMKRMVQDNFKRREMADGSAWERLSDVTIAIRRKGPRSGNADIPLKDSGVLYDSIAFVVTEDGVVVGTNVPYAPIHQFGAEPGTMFPSGEFTGVSIPAREFVYLRDEDIETITKMLTDDLIKDAFR